MTVSCYRKESRGGCRGLNHEPAACVCMSKRGGGAPPGCGSEGGGSITARWQHSGVGWPWREEAGARLYAGAGGSRMLRMERGESDAI